MNNELIAKIEALPDRDQLIWADPFIKIADLKSLAAELTLANKKLAILQASNDHYADEKTWTCSTGPNCCESQAPGYECSQDALVHAENNGYDFARKAQEEIARLEGENG